MDCLRDIKVVFSPIYACKAPFDKLGTTPAQELLGTLLESGQSSVRSQKESFLHGTKPLPTALVEP